MLTERRVLLPALCARNVRSFSKYVSSRTLFSIQNVAFIRVYRIAEQKKNSVITSFPFLAVFTLYYVISKYREIYWHKRRESCEQDGNRVRWEKDIYIHKILSREAFKRRNNPPLSDSVTPSVTPPFARGLTYQWHDKFHIPSLMQPPTFVHFPNERFCSLRAICGCYRLPRCVL